MDTLQFWNNFQQLIITTTSSASPHTIHSHHSPFRSQPKIPIPRQILYIKRGSSRRRARLIRLAKRKERGGERGRERGRERESERETKETDTSSQRGDIKSPKLIIKNHQFFNHHHRPGANQSTFVPVCLLCSVSDVHDQGRKHPPKKEGTTLRLTSPPLLPTPFPPFPSSHFPKAEKKRVVDCARPSIESMRGAPQIPTGRRRPDRPPGIQMLLAIGTDAVSMRLPRLKLKALHIRVGRGFLAGEAVAGAVVAADGGGALAVAATTTAAAAADRW
jgi:hypothetical protein